MAVALRSSSIRGVDDTQGGSVAIPVPSGAAADDVVICFVGQWDHFGGAITAPSGFTQIAQVALSQTRITAYWKRLTGSDTGSYTFSWTATNTWANGSALCFSGAVTSGSPIEDFDSGSVSGTSYPTLSVTTTTEPGLAWGAYNENSDGGTTVPTGFTEISTQNYGTAAHRIPGSTGSHSASGATSTSSMDLVVVLAAVQAAAASGNDATLAATLPALTSSLSGEVVVDAGLAGTLPSLAASFTAASDVNATIAATLPALTASLAGTVEVDGDVAATLPALTASLVASVDVTAALAATLPALTAELVGDFSEDSSVTLSATLPALTASVDVDVDVAAGVAAVLPALTATASAEVNVDATLAAILPALQAVAAAEAVVAAEFAATLPALTAALGGFGIEGLRGGVTAAPAAVGSIAAPVSRALIGGIAD